MNPIAVGVKDGAAMIGVCTKTLQHFIDAGLIPLVKLPSVKYDGERGKRILILVADLQAFAEKHREGVTK